MKFIYRTRPFTAFLIVVICCVCEDSQGQMIDLSGETARLAGIQGARTGKGFAFDEFGFTLKVRAARIAESESNYIDPVTQEKSAYGGTFNPDSGAGNWFSVDPSDPVVGDGLVALNTYHARCLWNLKKGSEVLRLPIQGAAGPSSIRGVRVYASLQSYWYRRQKEDKNEVRWWDLSTGEQLGAIPLGSEQRDEPLSGFGARAGSSQVVVAVEPDKWQNATYLAIVDLAAGTSRSIASLGRISSICSLLLSEKNHVFVATDGGRYEALVFVPEESNHRKIELRHPSNVIAACFSDDGERLATSHEDREIVLWDTAKYAPIRRWTHPDEACHSLSFSPDNRRLIASHNTYGHEVKSITLNCFSGESELGFPLAEVRFVPGTDLVMGMGNGVELWSATSGMPIAQPISLSAQRHYAIKTSQGYFDASKEMLDFFRRHEKELATDDDAGFIEKFYRPNVVRHVLSGIPHELALTLPKGYENPDVAIRLSGVSQQSAKISVTAKSTAGATLEQLQLTRVDRPLSNSELSKIPSLESNESSFRRDIEIPFPPGKNSMTITAVVTDSFGLSNSPVDLVVQRPQRVEELSGRLFVLAVGVAKHKFAEYNLKYPESDAVAIAEQLKRQEGLTFGEVHTQVYVDERATLQNVKDGLNWLERVATPDDTVVVFFAGHGLRGRRGLYYVTHEGDAQALQFTCLNWEDVAKSVQQIEAKQTLFLSDVCHAGAFAKTQLAMQSELADQLQEIERVLVFASSQGEELSMENDDLRHGAFTKAVLEGLGGASDQNGDGDITVEELINFTISRVPTMTNDAQHPIVTKRTGYDAALVLSRIPGGDHLSDDPSRESQGSPIASTATQVTGVVIQATNLMDGSKSIGRVAAGTRFQIELTRGNWMLGTFDVSGKQVRCWVTATAVRREATQDQSNSKTPILDGPQ